MHCWKRKGGGEREPLVDEGNGTIIPGNSYKEEIEQRKFQQFTQAATSVLVTAACIQRHHQQQHASRLPASAAVCIQSTRSSSTHPEYQQQQQHASRVPASAAACIQSTSSSSSMHPEYQHQQQHASREPSAAACIQGTSISSSMHPEYQQQVV